MTTTDLQQALENILTTICELLRVRTGFVANTAAQSGPRLDTSVGSAEAVQTALMNFDPAIFQIFKNNGHQALFVTQAGFWYVPLQTQDREHYLGLLGIQARADEPDLTPYEAQTVEMLVKKAELALEGSPAYSIMSSAPYAAWC